MVATAPTPGISNCSGYHHSQRRQPLSPSMWTTAVATASLNVDDYGGCHQPSACSRSGHRQPVNYPSVATALSPSPLLHYRPPSPTPAPVSTLPTGTSTLSIVTVSMIHHQSPTFQIFYSLLYFFSYLTVINLITVMTSSSSDLEMDK